MADFNKHMCSLPITQFSHKFRNNILDSLEVLHSIQTLIPYGYSAYIGGSTISTMIILGVGTSTIYKNNNNTLRVYNPDQTNVFIVPSAKTLTVGKIIIPEQIYTLMGKFIYDHKKYTILDHVEKEVFDDISTSHYGLRILSIGGEIYNIIFCNDSITTVIKSYMIDIHMAFTTFYSYCKTLKYILHINKYIPIHTEVFTISSSWVKKHAINSADIETTFYEAVHSKRSKTGIVPGIIDMRDPVAIIYQLLRMYDLTNIAIFYPSEKTLLRLHNVRYIDDTVATYMDSIDQIAINTEIPNGHR